MRFDSEFSEVAEAHLKLLQGFRWKARFESLDYIALGAALKDLPQLASMVVSGGSRHTEWESLRALSPAQIDAQYKGS